MSKNPMTEAELEDLVACYINVEGYTDFCSIYSVMKQEYPRGAQNSYASYS